MKKFLIAFVYLATLAACQPKAVPTIVPLPSPPISPAAQIAAPIALLPSPTAQIAASITDGHALAKILDGLQVETHWLKGVGVDWQTGEPNSKSVPLDDTHCSAFVAAVSVKLGVYLLRPPEHKTVLLANAQNEWLNASGAQSGWERAADGAHAQALANQGYFVIASYRNPVPTQHGHIAIVRPSDKSAAQILEEGPQIIQAGGTNYNSTSLKKGFAAHPSAFPKNQIQFFVHALNVR
jgi:hypothetical protein